MDRATRKSYKRIEELNTEGVIDLLETCRMEEFVDLSKEKKIDGKKLLNITEGIVKLWRPKANANKLLRFIEDLKTNPVKYLKELNETYDVVLRNEKIEYKSLNVKYEKEVITTMNEVANTKTDRKTKDMDNYLDIESQYQTVKKEKVKENQSNLNNVEEIIKRIVPAKSFLYRNQVKKESTNSYLPMEGSPKRRRLFRLSGYEYPNFDLKIFSKPDNADRGYYPMKRNSRFFVSRAKSESRIKYKSIATTEELKYPEDHFYEDLCYTDIDKPRSSISSSQTVKPYRVKIQELFQSFKIPFFKKNEDIENIEKDIEQSEEKIVDRVEEKKVFDKEHVYENSDSLSNMYDSVQAPVPISENKVKQTTRLPVEEYLEPFPVNKDYCDVNYRQKDDSILGYIMSIFENRLGFWRETNESAGESSDDTSHRTVDDKKWIEEKKGPKANMADRPLPVPVENEPYYMNIERTEAENMLKGQPNGTFLLRPSSQANHAYTVSVSCNDAVHNVGVRRRADGRMSLGFARRGERTFSDVTSLLRHHKKRRLLLVAHGEVIGATTLNESPQYYQTPCNIPIHNS